MYFYDNGHPYGEEDLDRFKRFRARRKREIQERKDAIAAEERRRLVKEACAERLSDSTLLIRFPQRPSSEKVLGGGHIVKFSKS